VAGWNGDSSIRRLHTCARASDIERSPRAFRKPAGPLMTLAPFSSGCLPTLHLRPRTRLMSNVGPRHQSRWPSSVCVGSPGLTCPLIAFETLMTNPGRDDRPRTEPYLFDTHLAIHPVLVCKRTLERGSRRRRPKLTGDDERTLSTTVPTGLSCATELHPR
jgi:hypothetical protein